MNSTQSLPVLYINAESHYEVGREIGATFKGWIREYLETEDGKTIRRFYQTDDGRALYDRHLHASEKSCPDIVQEIKGMAEGAEQSFEDMFLVQLMSEILFIYNYETESSAYSEAKKNKDGGKSCTDVMVNRKSCRILGHNEDYNAFVGPRSYIVHVTLSKAETPSAISKAETTSAASKAETTSTASEIPSSASKANTTSATLKSETSTAALRAKAPTTATIAETTTNASNDTTARNTNLEVEAETRCKEKYMSFMYPGDIAGLTFAMNRSLVFTINSLCPATINRDGVPVALLLRCLMSCETIDDCRRVMENDKIGCAYGMNINIACINKEEMYSMEVYPEQERTRVDVHKVPCEQVDDKPCHYFHQNHYKHLENIKELEITSRSKLRGQRADEMKAPRDMDGVLQVLGDTENTSAPIFRTPAGGRHDKTVATAAFDLTNKMLHVYRSNPKQAKQPYLSMRFIE